VKWIPHAYMKKAMRFCVERGAAGLFQDPGLGKTSEMYGVLKILRKAGVAENMLVISPLRPAHLTWPAEAQKWDDFKEFNVHVLHGPDKQLLLEQPHDVSIINPDGLPWLLGGMEEYIDPKTGREKRRLVKGAAQEAGVWWDVLVVDESTQFKHGTTQRFKTLRPHLPKFSRRYILTGDPSPNGLMDLWGQMFILDLGRSLGPYITHYRDTYFEKPNLGSFNYRLKKGADKLIYKAIAPLVLRMAAEDYLTLPELIINDVPVELPAKARKTYDQMENLMLAELEAGIVTAANAAVSMSKCRQLAGGGVFVDSDGAFEHVHQAKTEATVELVEQLQGKPALVAYEFKHELARLQKVFPKAPRIGGGVSTKEAQLIERQWNAGLIPVLLAQPQSVARGLNLQGTDAAIIFHTTPWDLEVYKQFIRRVWRQGQAQRVVVSRLIALKTVDQVVVSALARKSGVQQALFTALKDLAKERKRRGLR